MMDRRKFLQSTGAFSVLPFLGTSSKPAVAQTAGTPNGNFFLLVRGIGGWDVTLGLDPWTDAANLPLPSDMFVEYNPAGLLQISPKMKVGPSAEILKNYAGEFSIINGVFESQVDNGHGASLTYISSGSTAPTVPNLPIELARSTFEGDFGVLFNGRLEMGDRVVINSSVNELKALPTRTDMIPLLQSLISGGGSGYYFEALKKVVMSGASVQVFIKNLLSLAPSGWTDNQIVAAAFMSDVASCAQLDVFPPGIGFDTHAGHAGQHMAAQRQFWEGIDKLFTLFKKTPYGTNGGSLFDHTTFMVTSEFSRTPALNASGGKDHNPMTNSVLLAGRGVKGGQVVGGSRLVKATESPEGFSYHIAYPIDYATFEVQTSRTPEAKMIFPENVIETVATIMKVDRNIFRSTPPGTLPLLPLVKP